MDYLPLFHKLDGRPVLVIGGGDIALRKSVLLAEAGALINLVAPEIEPEVRAFVEARGGSCRVERRPTGSWRTWPSASAPG